VVNTSLIPTGSAGFGNERVQATAEAAFIPTDGVGAFRIGCAFSHMAFDDPIVYPGQPGRAHLHSFFGNTALNANTTAANITTTGNSTCTGGVINRSGYWVASIIDVRTGRPIKPDNAVVYYKTADWAGGAGAGRVQAMPAGLRMIAGNAANTQAFDYWWQSPVGWYCQRSDGSQYLERGQVIPACAPGDQVAMSLNFPACWDGVNLDSPDHKSHMAFDRNGCPATHPILLPKITMTIRWTVASTDQVSAWRLSSDNYDTTKPGGYSAHADWFNGWNPAVEANWLNGCVRAPRDCHAHLLGDGRAMY